MRQSSASAARVSCSLLLEPPPETIRLQRVVTNAPGLTVPSFALAELKTGDFSEIRLVEQGQITAMRRSLNSLRLFIIKGDPRGIWSAKLPAGAEPRDCKASATAWIVACSRASGPAVNADWAALPEASAEGRADSLISGETPEICTTKPLSNSRDRASGKSPPSSTRKERRRDITAAKEIRCKVESFTAEWTDFFQEVLRKLAGGGPPKHGGKNRKASG